MKSFLKHLGLIICTHKHDKMKTKSEARLFVQIVPLDFLILSVSKDPQLQEFCNHLCKREHVESNALNSWKLNIFKIIDGRISFYFNNLYLYHLNLNLLLDT